MPKLRSALLLATALAVGPMALGQVAGCVSGGPARLTSEWPDRVQPYDEAHATWTRKGSAYSGVDLSLAGVATFLSPSWRGAYVAEYARRAKLTENETRALRAKEEQASAEVWQFFVAAETHEYSANDLSRENRSMWTMTLLGPNGREVAPVDVRVDSRPRAELQTWFPDLGPFHKPYLITFPRVVDGQPVLTDGEPVTLKIGSALGTIVLRWD